MAVKSAAIRFDGYVPDGLKATTPKRFKLTTDSRHSFTVAPNMLDRNFDVDTPNKVWTADINYVWTYEGWLYLAIVMNLAFDALSMAYWQRKPGQGLLCTTQIVEANMRVMSIENSLKTTPWQLHEQQG